MSSDPDKNEIEPAAIPSSSSAIANVRVGNHSSSSVTISWVTKNLTEGYVRYGQTEVLEFSKREAKAACERHCILLEDLSENSTYYYEIVTSESVDNQQGSLLSFRTGEAGAGIPFTLFGCVVAEGGHSPADQIIVSSILKRGAISSYPLIALTGSDGMWLLNLGNLKDQASGSVLPYQVGDTIYLEFCGSTGAYGYDTVIVSESSPQDCDIYEMETIGACGDVDNSGDITIDDVVALVYYVFGADEETEAISESTADVDCSNQIDVDDIVYMVNFVFSGGPPPCDGC
jgi:hypothetical protein